MDSTLIARVSYDEDITRHQDESRQHPHGCMCTTCKETRQRGLQAPAGRTTKKWFTKNVKLCPNEGCGAMIQKAKGGKGVRCETCGHEFCWTCLEPCNGANREHHCRGKRATLRKWLSYAVSGYGLSPGLWDTYHMFLDM
ncbi:hypothetical protein F5B22DRAFT_489711 [Xylaria bambusicola]|uniref:uncharacterized protein n=1 Tax=Xylaria bambusicola TaxID=326684 RepID=UPI0020078F9E|nr:uncharacterized protein F5B22DRAFT_489711 [Xylaria bambusicola]KAI0505851.1 hypothetical protein F5B22DRAFT_489711 [Xylaria bambusicola]